MWIQLITCLPFPKIVASPNLNGFLNSFKAPPSLLITTPVRNFTNRFPREKTGSTLASHAWQVVPRKSSAGGSVSINGYFSVPFPAGRVRDGLPYQPIPEADITAFTLFVISFSDLTISSLLFVLLSKISFFLLVVYLLSA